MGDGDRKYRQRGYQDSSRGEKSDREKRPGGPPERMGPRSPQMVATRTVTRCAQCGAVLAASLPAATCAGCGAELHTCMQCSFFDPGQRFQCSKPVQQAVPDKRGRNDCVLFELKTTVERDASSSATPRTGDARSDLDALFKK
jgi:hypothetical protein